MLNNNNDKTVDIVKVSQIHLCCSEEFCVISVAGERTNIREAEVWFEKSLFNKMNLIINLALAKFLANANSMLR